MQIVRKLMLVGGVAILLCAAYWLYGNIAPVHADAGLSAGAPAEEGARAGVTSSHDGRARPQAVPGTDVAALAVGDNPRYPKLADRLQEMRARRPGARYTPEAVAAAVQQPSAWIADYSAAETLNLTPEERRDGRMFLRLNPLKIESLMPGDTLEMPIAQRRASYTMLVDHVEAHDDGSVTWRGRLKEFDQENQVTITQSEGLTYAGVTLPSDSYVMQVNGDKGWLARGSSLFKTTTPDDTIVPPHAHDAPTHGS